LLPSQKVALTDHEKPHCIACVEDKQTRNNQSRQDSGHNAPINRIGEVICSDLKGPVTPTDRNRNRIMVNFLTTKPTTAACSLRRPKTKKPRTLNAFSYDVKDDLIDISKSSKPTVALSTRALNSFARRPALQGK
jgi:hypothetical protein